jgi:hypothetical protein
MITCGILFCLDFILDIDTQNKKKLRFWVGWDTQFPTHPSKFISVTPDPTSFLGVQMSA